jgi:cell division protein FtsQ
MMSVAIPARPLLKRVRSGNLFSKRDTSVLDAPEQGRASGNPRPAGFKRGAAVTEMPLRRDYSYADDFGNDSDGRFDAEGDFKGRARRPGVRLSFHGGLVPKTLWGRIAAGATLLLLTGASIAGMLWVRSFLLHDAHFVIPTSDSIQIAGNSHLTRAQLLSVFGEDVDRNIFTIPLSARRAELENLPWVEHATVMRLLPNRVSVAIVERTPVAFVRQGAEIGLVDANGALFDLPDLGMDQANSRPGTVATPHYSFPVLTGISAEDPLSTRAARMRIYLGFMAALDATGEGISHKLSEVDMSNPEDIKAIIPDAASSNADILVHFGEEKYLERYHQYQEHLPEWRAQYPRLASVDMRYERQVVLQMQPGAAVPTSAAATGNPAAATAEPAGSSTPSAGTASALVKPAPAKTAAPPSVHPASVKQKKLVAKPAHKHVAAVHPKVASHASGHSAALQGAQQ